MKKIAPLPLVALFLSLIIACVPSTGLVSVPVLQPVAETPSPTPFQSVVVWPTSTLPVLPSATALPLPTASPIPTTSLIPADTPVAVLPDLSEPLNPLTGLPPFSPDKLERRPIAVKVTLFPRYARPQFGLTRADVVYEYYIEDGLSRFIAIFWGDDAEKVGPVRSGRFFDEHIARMYHSYLVYKSADDRVEDYLEQTDIHNLLIVPRDDNCPPLCQNAAFIARTGDSYNSWYFDTVAFQEFLRERLWNNDPQTLTGPDFSAYPSQANTPVARVFINFSVDDYHYWEFDPAFGRYLRYQETQSVRGGSSEAYAPLMDALTGAHVSADNLVVLYVPYTFENDNHREDEVYHIDLVKQGQAYLFRDGFAIPAHWVREQIDQPILITDPNGRPLALRPGLTFYEVLGVSSTLAQDGADWRFMFLTP